MKEVEKALRDRLTFLLIDRNHCLIQINNYLRGFNSYEKNELNSKYNDYFRHLSAYQLSDLYRCISLYRDEIKVLVKVLKIIKKKGEKQ